MHWAFVSKFSYLKELCAPKVKVLSLAFNAEGYTRAKVILESACGKPKDVGKVYLQKIVGLPGFTYHNVSKIHKFREKLLANVHSLETIGKLHQIN